MEVFLETPVRSVHKLPAAVRILLKETTDFDKIYKYPTRDVFNFTSYLFILMLFLVDGRKSLNGLINRTEHIINNRK